MPTLKSILGKDVVEKKSGAEAMLEEVKRINAVNGGTTY